MNDCLDEIADADPLPVYLETPNPRTIPFYQRHGFVVTGTAQAGGCPPITFMLRAAPRSSPSVSTPGPSDSLLGRCD
jgi:hypothetical protein